MVARSSQNQPTIWIGETRLQVTGYNPAFLVDNCGTEMSQSSYLARQDSDTVISSLNFVGLIANVANSDVKHHGLQLKEKKEIVKRDHSNRESMNSSYSESIF